MKIPRRYSAMRGRERMIIVTPVPSGVINAATISITMNAYRKFLLQNPAFAIPKSDRTFMNIGSMKLVPVANIAMRTNDMNSLISKNTAASSADVYDVMSFNVNGISTKNAKTHPVKKRTADGSIAFARVLFSCLYNAGDRYDMTLYKRNGSDIKNAKNSEICICMKNAFNGFVISSSIPSGKSMRWRNPKNWNAIEPVDGIGTNKTAPKISTLWMLKMKKKVNSVVNMIIHGKTACFILSSSLSINKIACTITLLF